MRSLEESKSYVLLLEHLTQCLDTGKKKNIIFLDTHAAVETSNVVTRVRSEEENRT